LSPLPTPVQFTIDFSCRKVSAALSRLAVSILQLSTSSPVFILCDYQISFVEVAYGNKLPCPVSKHFDILHFALPTFTINSHKMPSLLNRFKKAPKEAEPEPTSYSQDVPNLPAGMSQRGRPESSTIGNYTPRNPSNLSMGGAIYEDQITPMGAVYQPSKQPRPFRSYRLRGEYVYLRFITITLLT
jgi:hypothetical protein